MIEHITLWVLLLFGSLYAILHGILALGATRLFRPIRNGNLLPISVVIAARNEEKNLPRLLESLTAQDYPPDTFEIIIVNDRSTDSTAAIAEKFREKYGNIRLITISENTSDMPNKKNALRRGIEEASFEIIALTDADCFVEKDWLRSLSAYFTDDVGAVAGYSPYTSGNRSTFLRYEEYKNSILAASAVGIGQAFMCTGRNFAYRRSVFHEVNGFEQIKQSISGDDDLFIQLIQRRTAWKIRYMTDPGSTVRTLPPTSFRQFVNQRKRHVSASVHYPLSVSIGYGIIHLFHLSVIIGFFTAPLYALLALMVKFNIDGALIAYGKKMFREEFTLPEFILHESLLVVYSFSIAPLGFLGTFQWKER